MVRQSLVSYDGRAFAPATRTYLIGDAATFTLTTRNDSGYGPTAMGRIGDLGLLAPLALAALWEVGFAFEAGPLSTWNN